MNWTKKQFQDLCQITRGSSPRPIHEWISDFGVPWVKIADGTGSNSRYIESTKECIKLEAEELSVTVYPGDLLLSNSATPGMPKFMSIRACIHDGWMLLRNFNGLDKMFAYYLLLHERGNLVQLANGTVFQNLKIDILKNHEVLLPPLAEQRAIAEVLSTLDDKIELNHKMNQTLKGIAQSAFRLWFVDNEEITDWDVVELGEIVDIRRGASPRPINDYMGGEIPWLKIADATETGEPYVLKTKEYVTKSGAEMSVYVHPGDLILSNSATCGLPFFVDFHGCIHDGWLLFRNEKQVTKIYLYHQFLKISEHLIHIADGSVQKNLNTNIVAKQKINLPPADLITEYSSFVEPIFEKIKLNLYESRTLASLRDTLLPKLMRGEVRVKDVQ